MTTIKTLRFLLLLPVLGMVILNGCKSAAGTNASSELKLKLEKGKIYDYTFDFDINQQAGGQEVKSKMLMAFSVGVTAEEGDNKIMKLTYERIRMEIGSAAGGTTVDTDSPVPSDADVKANPMLMMNKMFAAMKGKTITMKANAAGDVLEVTGFEELINSIISSMGIDDMIKEKVRGQLKQQFNDKSVKDMFAQAFGFLPNKQIKVGDTWEKTINLPGATEMATKTTYTVKSIEADKATLDMVSKISSGTSGMSGDQTGIMVVDMKSGLMISSDFTQNMKMSSNGTEMVMVNKGKVSGKVR
jgi:Family of unknown function (DUF6263)